MVTSPETATARVKPAVCADAGCGRDLSGGGRQAA